MKRGYSKLLYNQRNKEETIMSVIKRLFGEHVTSRLVRTQNRELSFRCIAYNMHRLTNLFLLLMISTEPGEADHLREQILSFAKKQNISYDSLSVNDHIVFRNTSWLDAITTLSAVAAITSKIKVGTSILNIVVRNPVVCAKALRAI